MPVRKVKDGYRAFPGGPTHRTKGAARRQLRAVKASQARRKKR